jgi:hypothetical protein
MRIRVDVCMHVRMQPHAHVHVLNSSALCRQKRFVLWSALQQSTPAFQLSNLHVSIYADSLRFAFRGFSGVGCQHSD